MKTSIAILSLFSPLCNALVGLSWTIPNVPTSGLRNITFPMNIAGAPHTPGYFFAQQFSFIGDSNPGYIGLQPRPDNNGNSIIHAAFSTFTDGATTSDHNCSPGADGGPGVSCAIDIASNYDNAYHLVVENIGGTTWAGTLVNQETQIITHIGSWTLPAATKWISGNQVGFVEYYPWNSGSHSCQSLPYTLVKFGNVISSSGSGNVGNAYEYGDCVGQVNFRTSREPAGIQIQVGF